MKKIALLAGLAVLAGTGCNSAEKCSHAGCGFWYYNPPTLETKTPILLNPDQGGGTAHPMGSAAGPVSEGQYSHAPMAPQKMPAPPKGASISQWGGECFPPSGPPRMTIQEWCDVANTVKAKPLPMPTGKDTQ